MTLECIQSVYAETIETTFEIILVDNNSSDGSVDAIREQFPAVKVIAEKENLGFARATNKQAQVARAPLLLLLNTDTVVIDGGIDRLVAFSGVFADAGIWGGRTLFSDRSLNATSCWRRITPWSATCFALGLTKLFPKSRLFNPERFAEWHQEAARVDVVTGCFFLIRKSVWEALGGFDTSFFMYGEEADLCLRAAELGYGPMVTPLATIIHHGGASASNRADRIIYMFGSRIGLMNRYFARPWRKFGAATLIVAAWVRAKGQSVIAIVRPSPLRQSAAATWREVYRRQRQWRNGPLAKATDLSED